LAAKKERKEDEDLAVVYVTNTASISPPELSNFRIAYSWQPVLEEPTHKEIHPSIRKATE